MRTLPGSARRSALFLCAALAVILPSSACGPEASGAASASASGPATAPPPDVHVASATPEEAGRYLVVVGGCNDCHTEGFGIDPAAVPESEWLKGSAVGFRGPWGTSYPANLRLTAASMTEDQWVTRLGQGGLPPMPWYNVAHLSGTDARAMYRYIRSLGDPGAAAPTALGPGAEPGTAWIDFVPRTSAAVSGADGA